jgi:hypothetical protein
MRLVIVRSVQFSRCLHPRRYATGHQLNGSSHHMLAALKQAIRHGVLTMQVLRDPDHKYRTPVKAYRSSHAGAPFRQSRLRSLLVRLRGWSITLQARRRERHRRPRQGRQRPLDTNWTLPPVNPLKSLISLARPTGIEPVFPP